MVKENRILPVDFRVAALALSAKNPFVRIVVHVA